MPQNTNAIRSDLRTLGSSEAQLMLDLISRGQTVVTSKEATAILGNADRARGTVRRLVSKRWLQPVGGGRYVVLPASWGAERLEDYDAYVLASASVEVGYVGWWAAASRHGLTTQVPSEIIVATDRQVPERSLQGTVVRYVKLTARKLFGWEEMPSMGRTFRISSLEKTIVDCVDRPELAGGLTELALIISNAARQAKDTDLVQTAVRMGTISVGQRLGFLLDLCVPDFLTKSGRAALHAFIPTTARTFIGRAERSPGDIGFDSEWGVVANINQSALLAETGGYSWGRP